MRIISIQPAPEVQSQVTGSAPTRRTIAAARGRATRAVLGLLAALILTTGITAIATTATSSTASAWTNTAWKGRQGSIQWGQRTSCFGCFIAKAGYQFDTPQMLINQNGAIAGYQEITVRFDMQRADGAVVGTRSQRVNSAPGSVGIIDASAVFPLAAYRTPGWYRVVTTVTWGYTWGAYPSNAWTGYQQFVPSVLAEQRCAYTSASCTAGTGWVFMAA